MSEQVSPNPNPDIKDLSGKINDDTTIEALRELLDQSLNPKSKQVLGDQATEKILKAILSSAVFGAGISFGQDAFSKVATVDENDQPLPPDESTEVLNVARDLGIIGTYDKDKTRLVIKDPKLQANLERLLDEYEE